MTEPEALRLAEALEGKATAPWTREEAAAELRRLHAEVERMSADARRLDWLQQKGATVEMVFYRSGAPQYFRVGGLHSSCRLELREAIDAADAAMKDTT
jgi:predicted Ser/Thr protein kinase